MKNLILVYALIVLGICLSSCERETALQEAKKLAFKYAKEKEGYLKDIVYQKNLIDVYISGKKISNEAIEEDFDEIISYIGETKKSKVMIISFRNGFGVYRGYLQKEEQTFKISDELQEDEDIKQWKFFYY